MENLNIISIISSTISMVVVLYFLIKNLRKSRYDAENNRALMSDLRRSYENQIYHMNDRLVGSKSRWEDVNHLLLRDEILNARENYFNNSNIRLNNFLISNGIKEKDLEINKRMIFVLTPFNPKFEEDFYAIKKVCDDVGFMCVRGDEEFFASDIFTHILKMIIQSRLVIVNLNGRNPNVLYELGIAQALDKPTILITKNPNELPIDIKSKRFLVYKNEKDLKMMLGNELIKILRK